MARNRYVRIVAPIALVAACITPPLAFASGGGAPAPSNCLSSIHQSDAFVNSFGVNVHLASSGPYAQTAEAVAAVKFLGARHVRDVVQPHSAQQTAALHALSGVGVDADLSVNVVDPTLIDQRLAIIKANGLVGGGRGSIEGANEWDNEPGNWSVDLRNAQTHLYSAVKAEPAFAGVPVVAPALLLAHDLGNVTQLGSLGGVSDVGNVHTYPSGEMPEPMLGLQLARSQIESPGHAPWSTETGYHDDLAWSGGHRPASDAAQATYFPRLLASYSAGGFGRTFSYELVDDSSRAGSNQAFFGLFTSSWQPKPPAIVLSHLTSILADPGPDFAPCPAPLSIAGAPADLHELVLAKRDGRTEVLLWRAQSVWDTRAKQPIAAPSSPVTLSAPGQTISLYQPNLSVVGIPVGADRASIMVGPDLVIVELGGGQTPVPPSPTTTSAQGPTTTLPPPPPGPSPGGQGSESDGPHRRPPDRDRPHHR